MEDILTPLNIIELLFFSLDSRMIIGGKPASHLVSIIYNFFELPKTEIVIIGDNPETDLALAKKGGFQEILVFSGVTKIQPHLKGIESVYRLIPYDFNPNKEVDHKQCCIIPNKQLLHNLSSLLG